MKSHEPIYETGLNPCIKCGGRAYFLSGMYGNAHWGTKCKGCGTEVDSDNTESKARREWNAANPVKP